MQTPEPSSNALCSTCARSLDGPSPFCPYCGNRLSINKISVFSGIRRKCLVLYDFLLNYKWFFIGFCIIVGIAMSIVGYHESLPEPLPDFSKMPQRYLSMNSKTGKVSILTLNDIVLKKDKVDFRYTLRNNGMRSEGLGSIDVKNYGKVNGGKNSIYYDIKANTWSIKINDGQIIYNSVN